MCHINKYVGASKKVPIFDVCQSLTLGSSAGWPTGWTKESCLERFKLIELLEEGAAMINCGVQIFRAFPKLEVVKKGKQVHGIAGQSLGPLLWTMLYCKSFNEHWYFDTPSEFGSAVGMTMQYGGWDAIAKERLSKRYHYSVDFVRANQHCGADVAEVEAKCRIASLGGNPRDALWLRSICHSSQDGFWHLPDGRIFPVSQLNSGDYNTTVRNSVQMMLFLSQLAIDLGYESLHDLWVEHPFRLYGDDLLLSSDDWLREQLYASAERCGLDLTVSVAENIEDAEFLSHTFVKVDGIYLPYPLDVTKVWYGAAMIPHNLRGPKYESVDIATGLVSNLERLAARDWEYSQFQKFTLWYMDHYGVVNGHLRRRALRTAGQVRQLLWNPVYESKLVVPQLDRGPDPLPLDELGLAFFISPVTPCPGRVKASPGIKSSFIDVDTSKFQCNVSRSVKIAELPIETSSLSSFFSFLYPSSDSPALQNPVEMPTTKKKNQSGKTTPVVPSKAELRRRKAQSEQDRAMSLRQNAALAKTKKKSSKLLSNPTLRGPMALPKPGARLPEDRAAQIARFKQAHEARHKGWHAFPLSGKKSSHPYLAPVMSALPYMQHQDFRSFFQIHDMSPESCRMRIRQVIFNVNAANARKVFTRDFDPDNTTLFPRSHRLTSIYEKALLRGIHMEYVPLAPIDKTGRVMTYFTTDPDSAVMNQIQEVAVMPCSMIMNCGRNEKSARLTIANGGLADDDWVLIGDQASPLTRRTFGQFVIQSEGSSAADDDTEAGIVYVDCELELRTPSLAIPSSVAVGTEEPTEAKTGVGSSADASEWLANALKFLVKQSGDMEFQRNGQQSSQQYKQAGEAATVDGIPEWSRVVLEQGQRYLAAYQAIIGSISVEAETRFAPHPPPFRQRLCVEDRPLMDGDELSIAAARHIGSRFSPDQFADWADRAGVVDVDQGIFYVREIIPLELFNNDTLLEIRLCPLDGTDSSIVESSASANAAQHTTEGVFSVQPTSDSALVMSFFGFNDRDATFGTFYNKLSVSVFDKDVN